MSLVSSLGPLGTLAAVPAPGPGNLDEPPAAAADPVTAVDLYLEVSINGQPTGSIVSFVQRAGHLYVSASDLEGLGLDPARAHSAKAVPDEPASAPAEEPRARASHELTLIDLAALPGLQFRYDPTHQSIDLQVPDALRTPYSLNRLHRTPPTSTTGTGLVVNYDAFAQAGGGPLTSATVAVSSEQRWFGPLGVVSNTGTAESQDVGSHYIRQSTSYEYDSPSTLTSLHVGDTLSSSLSWTRAVRLGGIQLRRDFTLAPELITFPVPQLTGTAAVPSTVDLYVNNVRQFSGEVPSGPFAVNGIPGITGGGMATLVVRDAFGRSVSTSLPVYVDSRLLAAGLSSYSVEAGFLRENYGVRSFDYEGHAALGMTYRYGVNDRLTVESHGETTPGLANAGAGALARLGPIGVLSLSIAGSSGTAAPGSAVTTASAAAGVPGTAPGSTLASTSTGAVTGSATSRDGGQTALGYQLTLPLVSISAQTTRALGHYADLAAVSGTPAPRVLDQLTATYTYHRDQSIGASLIRVNDSVAGRSELATIWVSGRVTRRISAFFNASRDFDEKSSARIWLGISVDFGRRVQGFSEAGSTAGHATYGTSLSRSADYGGGWEWAVQSDRSTDTTSTLARTGYLGQYGEVSATVQAAGKQSSGSVEATGGVIVMDGAVEAARRIGAGFALVSTDGIPGVPVLHENRRIGVTDDGGHLLVPDLNPYEHNAVAIDTLALPADSKVLVDRLDVTPRSDSGVLARFPIEHFVAASVVFVDSAGGLLPAGTALHVRESGLDFVVGYDGLAFIERLEPHNHISARGADFSCVAEFDFAVEKASPGSLPTLGPIVCRPDAVRQP